MKKIVFAIIMAWAISQHVNAVEMLSDSPVWSYAVVSLKTSQSTDCYVFQVRDDMQSPYSMNGKTYHALYRVDAVDPDNGHQPFLVFSDPIGIREAEGRIYVNYDDFKRELDFYKEYSFLERDIPYKVTSEGEILLYDFTLQKGDEYPMAAGSKTLYVDKVEEIVTEEYGKCFDEICFAVYGREDGRNISSFRNSFSPEL